MNADAIISIGSTHSICQDYVIARRGYVILSDGCSSSPDTDIGARLLVKALDQRLSKATEIDELHKESARIALDWANALGLQPQSVDATLVSIHVTGEDLIIACSGDGVIILESQTGVLDVYTISSPSGYPFYPSYVHQPDRLAELVNNDRCTKTIKDFRSSKITTSDSVTVTFKFHTADYKYAAIASDGINSFIHTQLATNGKRLEPVSLTDVLDEFWSFKNSHGTFVERRLKRFKKDTQLKGWQHADDLAIGVIHLGEEHVRQDSQIVLER
jgi:serine/threonine protein phosphatase PrpC